MKSSRYCLNKHIEEFKKKCTDLNIIIYAEFPNEHYTWMQIEGEPENLNQLKSVD